MGGADDKQVLLGGRVLSPATGKGLHLPGGGSRPGLQVDQDYLSLLADENSLRRVEVPAGVEAPRITIDKTDPHD